MQGEQPLESDWKAFRALVPICRDRYLAKVNERVEGLLSAGSGTPTERFWNAQEEIEKEVGILESCLDGHSRSKMGPYAGLMYRYGMISDEDLKGFSTEFAERAKRFSEL